MSVIVPAADRSRRNAILLTVVVAALAAAVAGFFFFRSGKASGVNLTTAELVPEDALVYVGINTDLASNQWVTAFKLAERMGVEDAEEEFRDLFEDEADVDFDEEVAPFLGGDAGIFMSSFSFDGAEFEGAAIVRARDPKKAVDVLLREADDQGAEVDKKSYSGVDYYTRDDSDEVLARIGDHVIVASNERSLEDVIDVSKGKKKSLASRAEFQRLRDDLTRNFLGFVYLDTEAVLEDGFSFDEELREAFRDAGAGDVVAEPLGLVLAAGANGFSFQAASRAKDGSADLAAQPRESKLVSQVPRDTLLFLSTFNLADSWKKLQAENGDDALEDSLGDFGLDDAWREFGVTNADELLALLTGETAIAAWSDEGEPQGVLVAEVTDEAKAKSALQKATDARDRRTTKRTIAGKEVTFAGSDGAWAVFDGKLVLGSPEGVRHFLERDGDNLAGSRQYQAAVGELTTKLGSYLYLDLAGLFREIDDEFIPEVEGIESLILNVVNDGGLARFSGVLSIEE